MIKNVLCILHSRAMVVNEDDICKIRSYVVSTRAVHDGSNYGCGKVGQHVIYRRPDVDTAYIHIWSKYI